MPQEQKCNVKSLAMRHYSDCKDGVSVMRTVPFLSPSEMGREGEGANVAYEWYIRKISDLKAIAFI